MRLCGVLCGSRGKREGMCRRECGTEASLKELTGRQAARKGRGGAGGKEGKEEGVAGRRGCLLPRKPTQARPNPNKLSSALKHGNAFPMSLDQSHRCSGPLTWSQTVALATNVRYCCNNAFSQLPILGLQIHTSHLLSHQSEYFVIAFALSRLSKELRLLLQWVAASSSDRCTFANRPLALTSELPQEADAVHTLSATANLPGILALYPGVELCLETKVCSELGVVRGCPVLVEDI